MQNEPNCACLISKVEMHENKNDPPYKLLNKDMRDFSHDEFEYSF